MHRMRTVSPGASTSVPPLWLPAQPQIARLSSNAKLVVVDGSSRYIHWDRPTLVVDVIGQVVQAARTDQHLKS
jgi:hypothetical protein